MPTPTITVDQFTATDKDNGNGIFDVIMRAVKEHVAAEHTSGRLKGVEYSTVYLGALDAAMARSMELLMGKDKLTLELEILELQKGKVAAEKLLVDAQVDKLEKEVELAELEKAKVTADTARINAQKLLIDQQTLNAEKENLVLIAQECKLKAEFDLIQAQIPKVNAETALLTQKQLTERAQVNGAGVDADSVIGKQKILYTRQADGFLRDAEQKAAQILSGTWNVRRTTNDTEAANTTNKLDDASIGEVIGVLKAGVGA